MHKLRKSQFIAKRNGHVTAVFGVRHAVELPVDPKTRGLRFHINIGRPLWDSFVYRFVRVIE